MGEWVSVKKKKIPFDKPVLLTDGNGTLQLSMLTKKGYSYFSPVGFDGYEWDWNLEVKDVTHWRLAPKPPKPRRSQFDEGFVRGGRV